MEYKTYYEITGKLYGNLPTLLYILIATIMISLTIKMWKKNAWSVRAFTLFCSFMIMFGFVCLIFEGIEYKKKIIDEYFDGNYAIVEGIISDYNAAEVGASGCDSFNVNGVLFLIDGSHIHQGFV